MHKPLLISLFCLALILRMGAAIGIHAWLSHNHREYLIAGDADGYWRLGQKLASGDIYQIYEPPRQVLRMPGYPLLIATSIKLFGNSKLATRIIQAFLASLSVVVVSLLAKEFFDSRVATVSAILLAISPAAVGFSALLLSETLFAFLLLVNLLVAVRWLKTESEVSDFGGALLTGMTTTMVVYVRPTWLPALFVWAAMGLLLMKKKSRWGEALLVLMSGLVTLMPWAYRNHSLTGHWVLTTLWSGPSLYDGFHPEATGASDMSFFDQEQVMSNEGMTEFEMNRHYRDRSVEYIRSHPWQIFKLMLEHVRRFWSLTPNADQFRVSWMMVPLAIWNGGFLALGVLGAWSFRRRILPLIIVVGPLVAFAIIHTVFIGSLRYRLPAEYPFSIAVAVGLLLVWDSWQSRIRRFSVKGEVTQ